MTDPNPLQQLAEVLGWIVIAIDEREYYESKATPFERFVANERRLIMDKWPR